MPQALETQLDEVRALALEGPEADAAVNALADFAAAIKAELERDSATPPSSIE